MREKKPQLGKASGQGFFPAGTLGEQGHFGCILSLCTGEPRAVWEGLAEDGRGGGLELLTLSFNLVAVGAGFEACEAFAGGGGVSNGSYTPPCRWVCGCSGPWQRRREYEEAWGVPQGLDFVYGFTITRLGSKITRF